jgi:ArsR family transcriptional regulator, lead/cadmium/zinc/bismuth-responsive transcriptional repressor
MNRRTTRKTDPIQPCGIKRVDTKKIQRVTRSMEDEETIGKMAEYFAAFSDPTRLKIMMALSRDECCVCELAQIAALSPSATSHQLRILRALRLVKYRRQGQRAIYSLDDVHIVDIIRIMTDHYQERRA